MTSLAVGRDAATYNALRHIDQYEEVPPNLEVLGRELLAWGLQDVVLLTRLHKHFELADGERVVQRVDSTTNTIKSSPETGSSDAVACSWKLFEDGTSAPVSFLDKASATPALLAAHAALFCAPGALIGLAALVGQLGLSNLVGLSLDLGCALAMPQDAVMLENTYEERIQEVTVVPRAGQPAESSITTHWRAEGSGKGGISVQAKCVCNRGANVGHIHKRM